MGEIPGGEIYFCTPLEKDKERVLRFHIEGSESLVLKITPEIEGNNLYHEVESALGIFCTFRHFHRFFIILIVDIIASLLTFERITQR